MENQIYWQEISRGSSVELRGDFVYYETTIKGSTIGKFVQQNPPYLTRYHWVQGVFVKDELTVEELHEFIKSDK